MTQRALTRSIEFEEALAWLAKLESSRCSAHDEQAFFEWLNSSPVNQAAYVQAEQLWQRGGVLPQALANKAQTTTPKIRWHLPAAGVACSLLMVVVFLHFFNPQLAPTPPVAYTTHIGEQQSITLSDGSTATLNTDTHILVHYQKNLREITLIHGEALFDVTANAQRPFEVVTTNGRIRVLGTKFSVKIQGDDAKVTVAHGKVGLAPKTTQSFKATQVLSNNQQTTLSKAKQGQPAVTVNAQQALAWQKQQLIFNNAPLSDVILEINRYRKKPLALASQNLKTLTVTAVIPLSPQDPALSLAGALALTIEEQSQQTLLK